MLSMSSIIPHTRVYLKKFKFYERGRGLSISGQAKPSAMNKEVSTEFNDISNKGLHQTGH